MQKLEMNEKIKEIYINYHLINIRFEKKKKKTDKKFKYLYMVVRSVQSF